MKNLEFKLRDNIGDKIWISVSEEWHSSNQISAVVIDNVLK